MRATWIISVFLAAMGLSAVAAEPATRPAAVVALRAPIDNSSRQSFERRFNLAVAGGAETVIVDLDTYGGLVTSALEISHFLKQQKVHTIAYVNTKAYSAGSMIAIACDEIVVNTTSAIGDCAPIHVTEDGHMQTMGADERAKAVSPIIADFQDSALRNHHDPTLVLAMVSAERVVRWVENKETHERQFVDDQKAQSLLAGGEWRIVPDAPDPLDGPNSLLTIGAELAVKTGLARAKYASIDELAEADGLRIIARYETPAWDNVVDFITNTWVRALLIGVFLTSLYISLNAPGHGAAEVTAVVSLALAVGVPLLTGYAQWWEIVLVLVGMFLLALEIFVIPGFGVVGLAGAGMVLIGLLLTFIAPEPGRSPLSVPHMQGTWMSMQNGLLAIVGALFCSIIFCLMIRKYLPQLPMFRRLMLTAVVGQTESANVGSLSNIDPAGQGPSVGAHGVAITELKPGGTVQFQDAAGAVHAVSVISESGLLTIGQKVMVTRISGPSVFVRLIEESA